MFTRDQIAEVGAVARRYDQPEAHVLAVVQTESDGVVFAQVDGAPAPLIRFEGHIFFRRLAGAKRDKAVAEKLASQRRGVVKNPRDQQARYDLLKRACAIDRQAALESCSWGCGQVMGFHWSPLGFASVDALVTTARSGLGGQVELMLKYVTTNRLDDELRAGAWKPFARGYNGEAYAENAYDVKLAKFAAMYGGADAPANGMLRMGSSGRRVRELQALLGRAGYAVQQDGDFGPTTKKALQSYQQLAGLKADGIYGPETERLLGGLRQSSQDKPGKLGFLSIRRVKQGVVAIGAAGITADKVQDAKGAIEGVAAQIAGTQMQSAVMDYLATGLTWAAGGLGLVGLALMVRGWLGEKKTVEA